MRICNRSYETLLIGLDQGIRELKDETCYILILSHDMRMVDVGYKTGPTKDERKGKKDDRKKGK